MGKKQNRYRSDKSNHRGFLRKGIKMVLGVIVVTSSLVLLSAALAHSYYKLLEAPWLRVGEVQICGLKHMEREEVLNAMKVPRNVNVLTLKMSTLAERVEALPWVKSAVVRLDLPGRLVVEVAEREPMAVVVAEEAFLVDQEGKLFLRTDPENHQGLLRVSGITGANPRDGDLLAPQPLRELKRLLPALHKAQGWLPSQMITECRWRSDEGFVLFVTQKAIPVLLGSDDLDQTFSRLQQIFALIKERQWLDLVTRIDLDYPNRAYVEKQFGS